MMKASYTILVAEEDRRCADFLAENLAADGYEIDVARSREQALQLLGQSPPHVLLVDVNGRTLSLIDAVRDGRGVTGRINPDMPIIVLTGQTEELHRVRLLRRGADDVITKPFFYMELRERVAGILRRAYRPGGRGALRAGPVMIDLSARTVDVYGVPVELSRLEFDLLRTLATEPGRVFTREELLSGVWGCARDRRTRTLDSHASRLRRKLRAAGAERVLVNVWGVGFRLMDPEPTRDAA